MTPFPCSATSSGKLTVALVGTSVSRRAGGVFYAMRSLARSLAAQPTIDVHVLGSEDEHTAADRDEWRGVRLTTHRVAGPRAFGYAPGLRDRLDGISPSLVHVHGIWMYPSIACRRWCARHKAPCVVSPHGMLDPWALRHSGWKKRIAALVFEDSHLRHAYALHALCIAEAEAMRAYGLRNPIAVIPNAVGEPPAEPAPRPEWARELPPDCNLLLYLGRLHPKKRVLELIDAWRRSRPPDAWRLVVAGWGDSGYLKAVREAADRPGPGGRVIMAGPQFGVQKHAAFSSAAGFILPSMSEGLPMAVLEAWSYGLPVIVTAACNLPEGFRAGAALEIPAGPAGIAEALRRFFDLAEEDRRAMGLRGRHLALQRYSAAAVAAAMRSVYDWATGRAGEPAELLYG